jgi:hypothetical protein
VAIVVTELGARAWSAVTASGGTARVLAPLTRSIYLTAGDEIVWLASADAESHGRAILTSALPQPPPSLGDSMRLSIEHARRWQPPALVATTSAQLSTAARGLVARIAEIGEPEGLGAMLVGHVPSFPLDGAVKMARELAEACAANDPDAAVSAAMPLLGLGPGLTPAGDDFVGGAFFARVVLNEIRANDNADWQRAASAVMTAARERTHPISVALLGDLVAGEGYAALHDLAVALTTGVSDFHAAQRLTRIGHSSGWDVLAGFLGVLVAQAS